MKYNDIPEFNTKRWFDITPLDGEIWRKIEGWDDAYEISNYGRVKSCYRLVKQKNGRIRPYKEKIKMTILMNGKKYMKKNSKNINLGKLRKQYEIFGWKK